MKLPGRLSAAIDVLQLIEERHLPAKNALAEWGRAHRFAGSKDRAAIGNLVYDILRNKSSLAWMMEDDSPRALTLAGAVYNWGEEVEALSQSFEGDKFAPSAITEKEQKSLTTKREDVAPAWVNANIPEWLYNAISAQFKTDFEEQANALLNRAPIDIRVNGLKSNREKLVNAFSKYNAGETTYSPFGVRLPAGTKDKKSPNIEADAEHGKGWFEIQDEGSQIASLLTNAKEGDQVLDFCAGAGGKTLALSAIMKNKGQIHAYDADKHRLRPIFERLKRAGCRNVQTLEAGNEVQLEMLKSNMDIVLVDAPCTGSGTWRRHPDAKWRLSEKSLGERMEEQRKVLRKAADHVKPGGKLVYVTCSLLPSENKDQIEAFIEETPAFKPLSYKEQWQQSENNAELNSANDDETYLTLTPKTHNTDGFFISILEKQK